MRLCGSIKSSFFVVAVGNDVIISRSCILCLSDFFRESIALLDDFLLFLDVLLSDFVKIKAVDFGIVSRCALLKGIDGRSVETVLDESKSSSSE